MGNHALALKASNSAVSMLDQHQAVWRRSASWTGSTSQKSTRVPIQMLAEDPQQGTYGAVEGRGLGQNPRGGRLEGQTGFAGAQGLDRASPLHGHPHLMSQRE